jgi:hypothetical protein
MTIYDECLYRSDEVLETLFLKYQSPLDGMDQFMNSSFVMKNITSGLAENLLVNVQMDVKRQGKTSGAFRSCL